MAQAVNVIMSIDGKEFDLNNMGLINMTFNRLIQNTTTSNFLTNMEITIMDKTGWDLMALLQRNKNKILVKYGFSNDLSETYSLTVIRIKPSYTGLGAMFTILAVGSQVNRTSGGELWVEGTSIDKMLRTIAKRNGWQVGAADSNEFIDVGNLRLPRSLYQKKGSTDWDFLNNELLPILNQSVLVNAGVLATRFWELNLINTRDVVEFYCRPYGSRNVTRRVWEYDFGSSTGDSQILEINADFDYTFLLEGLMIEVPISRLDSSLMADDEELKEVYTAKAMNKIQEIQDLITEYNLPIPNVEDFKITVNVVESENVGNQSVDELIYRAIENAVQALATAELKVVGNPRIAATDLIKLTVKNRDGSNSLISSTGSSLWRVVDIRETIGLSGYTTTLSLVREKIDKGLPITEGSATGGGIITNREIKTITN